MQITPSFRIFVATGILMLGLACGSDDSGTQPGPADPPAPDRIVIGGVGPNGIFDAGPAQDDAGGLWMSYSEVTSHATEPRLPAIQSRIAQSTDGGETWNDVVLVNAATAVVPPPPNDTIPTGWVHEVSRLVYDPFAPAGTEWKLLWHRYLSMWMGSNLRLFEHGWMGLRTSATPAGAWSSERKLFTGVGYDSANDATIGPPEFRLDALFPGAAALGGCALFTEPALLVQADGIYVAMLCGSLPSSKVVLLRCGHDFSTVEYLGDFLTDADAALVDPRYDGFSAAELVETDQNIYLIVTPTVPGDGYRGCLVFAVTDLGTATLARSDGTPTVVESVFGTAGTRRDHEVR